MRLCRPYILHHISWGTYITSIPRVWTLMRDPYHTYDLAQSRNHPKMACVHMSARLDDDESATEASLAVRTPPPSPPGHPRAARSRPGASRGSKWRQSRRAGPGTHDSHMHGTHDARARTPNGPPVRCQRVRRIYRTPHARPCTRRRLRRPAGGRRRLQRPPTDDRGR